jgi:hypothetical protein
VEIQVRHRLGSGSRHQWTHPPIGWPTCAVDRKNIQTPSNGRGNDSFFFEFWIIHPVFWREKKKKEPERPDAEEWVVNVCLNV